MALKKPGELFGKEGSILKKTNGVGESFTHIKEEFDKVEELRKQLDSATSSLNESITEVENKNLSLLSNEYSEQIDKFNNKLNRFKEEINHKVDDLEKSNQSLKTELQVVEERQNGINTRQLKNEVLSEVQTLLSGDVADNIRRVEEKIEIIRDNYKQTLNEGLLNEPPKTKTSDPLTPLDKDFVTQDELQKHYKLFINRIQQQLATLGGGGAVLISDLDDVDTATAKVNNKYLKYNSSTGKWVGADAAGGGSGITTEFISAQTLNVAGVSTFAATVNIGSGERVNFGTANQSIIAGSSSLTIEAAGSQNLLFKTNGSGGAVGNIKLQAKGGEESIVVNPDAGVDIYYDNTKRLATSNTGAIVTGILTATQFKGDGSGLTGIVGSGSGVVVKHDGSTVGTAGTINFSTNLDVSAISAGIVTVTASAGSGSTEFVAAQTLTVAGVTTHYQDVQFPGAAYNILWDQATSKIKFDDSAQCVFGSASGGDMKLFHASGNSTIRNETGQFRIAGNDIRIQTQNHSEDYIICTDGADVKLFFNDNEKFATTNTGAIVTGILTATSFVGDGSNLTGVSAALGSRGTTSAATGSIAQTAKADIIIPTGGKSFTLLKVAISAPAWVVLYVDAASRTSDNAGESGGRSEGTDPAPGSGVLTEVSTTGSGATTFLMSPAVLGWNNDSTPAAQVYARVRNKRATSGSNAITVTLTTVKLEA